MGEAKIREGMTERGLNMHKAFKLYGVCGFMRNLGEVTSPCARAMHR